jgi:hypothetical protein
MCVLPRRVRCDSLSVADWPLFVSVNNLEGRIHHEAHEDHEGYDRFYFVTFVCFMVNLPEECMPICRFAKRFP